MPPWQTGRPDPLAKLLQMPSRRKCPLDPRKQKRSLDLFGSTLRNNVGPF
jgi:hypothetical protein